MMKDGDAVGPAGFVQTLAGNRLGPFVGVPCSILAPLLDWVLDNPGQMAYYNPANEAQALGVAAGLYLATGKAPVVFSQNSGLGNMINPLTSLSQIYGIPAFLLITWRGAGGPGTDAPEHDIMGRDLEDYLKASRLPYEVLSPEGHADQVETLAAMAYDRRVPVAAIVRHGFFEGYERSAIGTGEQLSRRQALQTMKESLQDFVLVSTTGLISRESFDAGASPDFYMLGSMGLAAAIGCGAALGQRERRIAVLDGDGAALMHLGLIPFIGSQAPENLVHFVLDDGAYASTHGQPTLSSSVEFDKVALACGYRAAFRVDSAEELRSTLTRVSASPGPLLVWVRIGPGSRKGLGRVSFTPEEIRDRFMDELEGRR